jgi:hypothetical protein
VSRELSLGDQIARVERRIEVRRERTARHYDVAKADARERFARIASWWPLLAVVASLGVGLALSRLTRGPAYAEAPRSVAARPAAKRGMLVSLLPIVATGFRIAGSNEARTILNALRGYRARRRY